MVTANCGSLLPLLGIPCHKVSISNNIVSFKVLRSHSLTTYDFIKLISTPFLNCQCHAENDNQTNLCALNHKNCCNKQLLNKSKKISNLVIFLTSSKCLNYQHVRQKGKIVLEVLINLFSLSAFTQLIFVL